MADYSDYTKLKAAGTQSLGKTSTTTTAPAAQTAVANQTDAPDAAEAETAAATTSGTMRTPTTAYPQNAASGATRQTITTYTPSGIYDPANVEAFNKQRETDIRNLYAAAHENALASMKTAYDQNMSDAEAAREKISPRYQQSMNALSAEYERQRRNNNMQANASGLNTGAGSQMALAQSANYQANQAGLAQKENEALNEADRQIGDLQRNYQNAIAEAAASNNYKRAAALMEEYQNAYNRMITADNTNYTRTWNEDERSYSRSSDEAARMAQYGDFSGYRDLYGEEIANAMELTWAMQNPYIAWASGKLSAEDFEALTGRTPNDSTSSAGGSSSGRKGGSNAGTKAYYAAIGKAAMARSSRPGYFGPPGYLNTDGQFVVPNTSYGNYSNITPAAGHELDAVRAGAYADNYASTGNTRSATAAGTQAVIDRRGLK